MKQKNKRLTIFLVSLASLGLSLCLVLVALNDNITFFYSPKDIVSKNIEPLTKMRLGGMVEKGTVVKDGIDVEFKVTDFQESIYVHYQGVLPDLFREGQGIVADGYLRGDGVFMADTILAKHDENYMPPEIADLEGFK